MYFYYNRRNYLSVNNYLSVSKYTFSFTFMCVYIDTYAYTKRKKKKICFPRDDLIFQPFIGVHNKFIFFIYVTNTTSVLKKSSRRGYLPLEGLNVDRVFVKFVFMDSGSHFD